MQNLDEIPEFDKLDLFKRIAVLTLDLNNALVEAADNDIQLTVTVQDDYTYEDIHAETLVPVHFNVIEINHLVSDL